MRVVNLDWETFSAAGYVLHADGRVSGKGIKEVGTYAYAEHPSTEVLWLSYRWGSESRLWRKGEPPPQELFDLLADEDTRVSAFHWQFEWAVWHLIAHLRMGWPALPSYRFICSSAIAKRYGLAGGLEVVAQQLLGEGKDPRGTDLIKLFSVPRKIGKDQPNFKTPHEGPEALEFGEYCARDTFIENGVLENCPPLSEFESAWFRADQKMVTRGVRLDLRLLDALIREHQHLCDAADSDMVRITEGAVSSTTQATALAKWCTEQGVPTDSVAEARVDELLALPHLPERVAEALECRRTAASANIRKAYAMKKRVSYDGRLRGAYSIWGATQTGRYSAEGAQLQNLSSLSFEYQCNRCGKKHTSGGNVCCGANDMQEVPWNADAVDQLVGDIVHGDLTGYDRPINALVAAVRSVIVASSGKVLVDADYSSIESVVTAVLAGCQWRIDVFERGECIYTHSAAAILGKTYEFYAQYKAEHGKHHPDRKRVGKVAELASGFQGWIGAWRQFGAAGTDDEVKAQILAWRKTSPEIVEMWGGQIKKINGSWVPYLYGLEGAAIAAIINPDSSFDCRDIAYCVVDGVLECTLLSGRKLYYHNPRLGAGRPHYSGLPTVSIVFDGFNSDATQGVRGWGTRSTYGGRLFQNAVQATAADIMAHGMISAENRGLDLIMTTHDQLTVEADGADRLDELVEAMCDLPQWAKGWPLKAVGFTAHRFYKD